MIRKGSWGPALLVAMSLPTAAQESSFNVEKAILAFVNDPNTTSADLQTAVQYGFSGSNLDGYMAGQVAASILTHRAGLDGVVGTADDNPFDTLLELYSSTTAGPEAMEGLEIYAGKKYFGLNGPSAILKMVNKKKTTEKLLDGPVGLHSQAARNLVAYRDGGPDLNVRTKKDNAYVPYVRIFGTSGASAPAHPAYSVDAVPYVGPSAIQKIFDHAMGTKPKQGYVLTEADAQAFLNLAVSDFLAASGEFLWTTYGYGAFGGEAYTDQASKDYFFERIGNHLLDFGSPKWGKSKELVGQTFSGKAAAQQAIAEVVSGLWEENAELLVQSYAESVGEALP